MALSGDNSDKLLFTSLLLIGSCRLENHDRIFVRFDISLQRPVYLARQLITLTRKFMFSVKPRKNIYTVTAAYTSTAPCISIKRRGGEGEAKKITVIIGYMPICSCNVLFF